MLVTQSMLQWSLSFSGLHHPLDGKVFQIFDWPLGNGNITATCLFASMLAIAANYNIMTGRCLWFECRHDLWSFCEFYSLETRIGIKYREKVSIYDSLDWPGIHECWLHCVLHLFSQNWCRKILSGLVSWLQFVFWVEKKGDRSYSYHTNII